MRPVLRVLRYLPLLLLLAVPATAATTAFVGAHIIPIEGAEIPDGTLIITDGVITAVGPRAQVSIPDEAEVIDVKGRFLMPGLVDTHSHIGGFRAADNSGPIQPGVRISDGLNVFDAGYRRAVAGGLTTLNVMPGSGFLSSGQTIYLKMRRTGPGTEIFEPIDLAYTADDGQGGRRILGGLKMANGTNSQRKAPFPGTRAKAAYLVREKFIAAREYAAKIEAADGDAAKMPPRDLDLETLVEVMAGQRVVHHHTHRADDIMTVLRLKEEFGFEVVLHHLSEGWKVAEQIAASGAGCSIINIDSPGGKLEAVDLRFETGARLAEAGALVAYHTDDWITDSRLFLRSAAMGMRGGLDRNTALKSVTLNGAIMLGLDDKVGSLSKGKDADFIILDGDPLSVYSQVQQTWVEGQLVFDYTVPADRLHAEGGQGAAKDMEPFLCCYDNGGES
ncbi:MAG: amidohydrolase family protein [Candidatus Krumholzibacteria bacterium]|nr:amidohydrolase family protein [Candidatus Krumholzibacteria bacterium]